MAGGGGDVKYIAELKTGNEAERIRDQHNVQYHQERSVARIEQDVQASLGWVPLYSVTCPECDGLQDKLRRWRSEYRHWHVARLRAQRPA